MRTDDLTVGEDDVDMGVIVLPIGTTDISDLKADAKGDAIIYNLAGQRMHGDLNSLPHGFYIVGDKKVVK